MTRRIVKRGTGVTAKAYLKADGADMPDAVREILARWGGARSASRDDFDARVLRVEKWAHATLKRTRTALNATPGTRDKPKDYALRVLDGIGWIRTFIERGDAAQAARHAVNLGILMQEAAFKFEWEHRALIGERRIRSARSATDAKHSTADKRTRRIAELWNAAIAKSPDRFADDIGQQVRAAAHVSQSTLERHIARARELGLIPSRHRRVR